MAKAILTEEERQLDRLYDDLEIQCKKKKLRQKHIAAELGIEQGSVSYLIRNRKLSLRQFIQIQLLLGNEVNVDVRT
jgi:predicted XRE-type DNA-binding protein